MPHLQCPKCGLSNRSTHRQCLRCYTPLEGLEGFHAPQPTIGQDPGKRKLIVGVALAALLVIVGVPLTYKFAAPAKKVANPNAVYEAALSASATFNVPVIVDACRHNSYNTAEQRSEQDATPAAYVLESLGMIYIHNGMYSDAPMTKSPKGGYWIDPYTGIVPQQYRHVELEVTQSGQPYVSTWEPYEKKDMGLLGWKVPIGERQLGRVIQVMPLSDNRPMEDAVLVSFTWKWKPNEIGQSFDKQNPAYIKPKGPLNFPGESMSFDINDSRAVYWGTAILQREGGRWAVGPISWVGTQGTRLVPNQIEEIDRILEEQRRQATR
jgi:hypothetical protein